MAHGDRLPSLENQRQVNAESFLKGSRKRSISKPTTMTLLENQSNQRNSNQDLGVAPKIEEPVPVNNYVTSGVMYASPTADYINTK